MVMLIGLTGDDPPRGKSEIEDTCNDSFKRRRSHFGAAKEGIPRSKTRTSTDDNRYCCPRHKNCHLDKAGLVDSQRECTSK